LRRLIKVVLTEHFGSPMGVVHGEAHDLASLPTFVCIANGGEHAGVLSYRLAEGISSRFTAISPAPSSASFRSQNVGCGASRFAGSALRIVRQPILGGLINEYRRAA
jgi:hypothetical protein